jgi:hypothetical protein
MRGVKETTAPEKIYPAFYMQDTARGGLDERLGSTSLIVETGSNRWSN